MDEMLHERLVSQEDGRLTLTFEVVYGHAFKPKPRLKVQAETRVSLDEMRSTLKSGTRENGT